MYKDPFKEYRTASDNTLFKRNRQDLRATTLLQSACSILLVTPKISSIKRTGIKFYPSFDIEEKLTSLVKTL
jgi:hypothetical protein